MGAAPHEFPCPSCGAIVSVSLDDAGMEIAADEQVTAECAKCGRSFGQSEIDQFLDALGR